MSERNAPDGCFLLRTACFLACIPSGGSLLARVYGLAPMREGALGVALPCCLGLVAAWAWARRTGRAPLADALAIGFLGGLLGTLAYDLARVPFHLAGQRVFAPIAAYGVWVVGADRSSRFTEAVGWVYHFSNGITFGVMYALFLRGRHWAWAILWAFTLETITVLSPFGRIFSLQGNYPALGIAYLGHLAYGLPLGWLVYRWEETRAWLASVPGVVRGGALALAGVALVGPLLEPGAVGRDARAVPGEFQVEGNRLNPDWLRIERGGSVGLVNPGPGSLAVLVRPGETPVHLEAGREEWVEFPAPGIFQVHVATGGRSQSSFVIVEPVEGLE